MHSLTFHQWFITSYQHLSDACMLPLFLSCASDVNKTHSCLARGLFINEGFFFFIMFHAFLLVVSDMVLVTPRYYMVVSCKTMSTAPEIFYAKQASSSTIHPYMHGGILACRSSSTHG